MVLAESERGLRPAAAAVLLMGGTPAVGCVEETASGFATTAAAAV